MHKNMVSSAATPRTTGVISPLFGYQNVWGNNAENCMKRSAVRVETRLEQLQSVILSSPIHVSTSCDRRMSLSHSVNVLRG